MNVCPLETDSERVWADAGQRAAPANKTTATIVNITIWMSLRKLVIDWLLRDTRNHDGSSWKMQARNPCQVILFARSVASAVSPQRAAHRVRCHAPNVCRKSALPCSRFPPSSKRSLKVRRAAVGKSPLYK